jgi:excisionase family DNA binding protein
MSNNEMRKENEQDQISIPRLLSAKDVGEILGISVKTVNKLVREAKLGCVQVTAKELRFTEEQVQAYIEAQSKEVRVDTRTRERVKSAPPEGGEKSYGVSKADLRKEMKQWA